VYNGEKGQLVCCAVTGSTYGGIADQLKWSCIHARRRWMPARLNVNYRYQLTCQSCSGVQCRCDVMAIHRLSVSSHSLVPLLSLFRLVTGLQALPCATGRDCVLLQSSRRVVARGGAAAPSEAHLRFLSSSGMTQYYVAESSAMHQAVRWILGVFVLCIPAFVLYKCARLENFRR
jgi:hypothetical protein